MNIEDFGRQLAALRERERAFRCFQPDYSNPLGILDELVFYREFILQGGYESLCLPRDRAAVKAYSVALKAVRAARKPRDRVALRSIIASLSQRDRAAVKAYKAALKAYHDFVLEIRRRYDGPKRRRGILRVHTQMALQVCRHYLQYDLPDVPILPSGATVGLNDFLRLEQWFLDAGKIVCAGEKAHLAQATEKPSGRESTRHKTLSSLVPDLAPFDRQLEVTKAFTLTSQAHIAARYAFDHHFSPDDKRRLKQLFRVEYDKALFAMRDLLTGLNLDRDARNYRSRQCESLYQRTRDLLHESLDTNVVDHDRFGELQKELMQIGGGTAFDTGSGTDGGVNDGRMSFPAGAQPPSSAPKAEADPDGKMNLCPHSSDFRSLTWFKVPYAFTAYQAVCVSVWYQHWKTPARDVGDETVLQAAECESKRVSDLFKKHRAWGNMIVSGGTRGTHRLREPEEPMPTQKQKHAKRNRGRKK